MLEIGRLWAAFLLTSALIYGWLSVRSLRTPRTTVAYPESQGFFYAQFRVYYAINGRE